MGIHALLRSSCAAAVACGWLLLGSAGSLLGQDARACPDGSTPRGDIGLSGLECENCAIWTLSGGGVQRWVFNSEPRVKSVEDGSPADGRIRPGDAIVAVDGHLITTSEGGRRFANLVPGRDVSMVVRSGRTERTVKLVPEARCSGSAGPWTGAVLFAPDAPSIGVGVARPAQPSAGVPPTADAPPAAPVTGVAVSAVPRPTYSLLPSGWFGFGIQCTDCRWSVEEETGRSEWEFSAPPEISSIRDGSPAEVAGLRRGDVLLEIDGVALVSDEGGRRFGSVEPGETVELTYRRGGEVRKTTATAARRPDAPVVPPVPDRAPPTYSVPLAGVHATGEVGKLRYSGLVGPTSVEVRGTGSVVVNVIERGREIEIVTADSRTRIRLEDDR